LDQREKEKVMEGDETRERKRQAKEGKCEEKKRGKNGDRREWAQRDRLTLQTW